MIDFRNVLQQIKEDIKAAKIRNYNSMSAMHGIFVEIGDELRNASNLVVYVPKNGEHASFWMFATLFTGFVFIASFCCCLLKMWKVRIYDAEYQIRFHEFRKPTSISRLAYRQSSDSSSMRKPSKKKSSSTCPPMTMTPVGSSSGSGSGHRGHFDPRFEAMLGF